MRAGMRIMAAIPAMAFMSGCMVGPDYVRPDLPSGATYVSGKLLPKTAAASAAKGEAQSFVQAMDIPAQWWTLFHSSALTAMVDQVIKANPSLDAAKAALRGAQENVYAGGGRSSPS